MEQCKPSSSNEHDKKNSNKYKFYRKPSIKKKGPEVKQTKTSLARLLKANPLLKYEISTKQEPSSTTDVQFKPVKTEAPKISINSFAGNGPHVKCRIISFERHRISSSDFVTPICSSTFIESDDAFIEHPQKFVKYVPKTNSSKEVKPTYNNILNIKKRDERKSLSSQYMSKKKQEFKELTKKGSIRIDAKKQVIPLRRSLSADNVGKYPCYKIEEEDTILTESKSVENLSQKSVAGEIIPTSTVLTAITLEDLKSRQDKSLAKQIMILSNGEVDDENKENIEIPIIESDSYEDLNIPKNDSNINNLK